MKQFKEIYEANHELEILFAKEYNFFDHDIFLKNAIELLVEISELANASRCFKYWSKKEPCSKEIILDEYADCILMILAFCESLDISFDEKFIKPDPRKINEQFLYLYQISSTLVDNYNKKKVKEILANLIYLGKLLNFSDQDIITGCLHKININKKRLENSFME